MFPLEFLTNAATWTEIKDSATKFALEGFGGPGSEAIGIIIAAIGVLMAGVSYVVHKYNQQSRMPGPFINLFIGFIGAVLMSGVKGPIEWLKSIRDVVFGWLGI